METAGSLRQRYPDAFEPKRWIYWTDMLGSALLGWSAFLLAFASSPGSARWTAAWLVAVLALYRAVLFIHEIAHLKRGAVPGFELGWNLCVGIPLLAPSLLYVGSHLDHHRAALYGTEADPEYEPLAHWRPWRIVAASVAIVLVPALLPLRWGLLGPLSWILPPFRPLVIGHLSTLVINVSYHRRPPRGKDALRWALEEAATTLWVWGIVAAVLTGRIPGQAVTLWYVTAAAVLFLNHLRTLAAHRYENRGGRMDAVEQLRDSVNVLGAPWLTALAAPVGLRYHALHHFAPTLPYHSLGRLHRRLRAELPPSDPYREADAPGILPTVASLLRRAARRQRDGLAANSPGT